MEDDLFTICNQNIIIRFYDISLLMLLIQSSEIRANMIDLTAIAGAVATVFVFFTITLVKYVRKWEIDGFLPFLIP